MCPCRPYVFPAQLCCRGTEAATEGTRVSWPSSRAFTRASSPIVGQPLLSVTALVATQGGLLLTLCERARAVEWDPRLGGVNNRSVSLSQRLWGLEVQDRGVSGAASFRGLCPWLVVGHLFVSSHPLSVRVCVLASSSYKITGLTGLGPSHRTSFYLSCHFKDPVSRHSQLLRCWA